jgi:hypothetical protein
MVLESWVLRTVSRKKSKIRRSERLCSRRAKPPREAACSTRRRDERRTITCSREGARNSAFKHAGGVPTIAYAHKRE